MSCHNHYHTFPVCVSRDFIALWGFPEAMALPVPVFGLPVSRGMAMLYHGRNFVGCFRGSFKNWPAIRLLFPAPLVY